MHHINLLRPMIIRVPGTTWAAPDESYTAEQWALIFLFLLGELAMIALFFWLVS